MIASRCQFSVKDLELAVVYKHSRYSYAKSHGTIAEKKMLGDHSHPITQSLLSAHHENERNLEQIANVLSQKTIPFKLICRADLHRFDLTKKLLVSVGGDGTLLDCSHYVDDTPVLGLNSDPNSSVGALCIANRDNFSRLLDDILCERLKPSPIARLYLKINGQPYPYLALNDILFAHKNPGALSRFDLAVGKDSRSHRSSGIWVSTAAGSSGGIFSAGSNALAIENNKGLFRVREPYFCSTKKPSLIEGEIDAKRPLTITSTMTDGRIFFDGPHKKLEIHMGDEIEIGLSKRPLWLFEANLLNKNRTKIIEQRRLVRELLS